MKKNSPAILILVIVAVLAVLIWKYCARLAFEAQVASQLTMGCQSLHTYREQHGKFPPIGKWKKAITQADQFSGLDLSLPMMGVVSTDRKWLCEMEAGGFQRPLFIIPELGFIYPEASLIYIDVTGRAWVYFGTEDATEVDLTGAYYTDLTAGKDRMPVEPERKKALFEAVFQPPE